jgi:hypothetical protein
MFDQRSELNGAGRAQRCRMRADTAFPAAPRTRLLGSGLAIFLLAVLQAHAQSTASAGATASVSTNSPAVLQVGSYHGKPGHFTSIQAAVDAARPGDWILIAPGDYHEQGSTVAGVWVTTPSIHLRGMNRNHVIVDGTNHGASQCSAAVVDQNLTGRNGIEIYKASGVTVENLTVCNFLGDAYGNLGNQIWWNGGDGSGQIGLGAFHGAYLTASSTFYDPNTPNLAQYGIFASNSRGPGVIEYSYASNMSDSAFYIGACPDCNTTLRYVHGQNSAQGYSGTNSGGHLIIEESEWDQNQSGIVPSTLSWGDPPSPQNGACPGDPDASCTFIQYNYIHDNNNPNTPAAGVAATVAVGTGIDLSGGRNTTVRFNAVTNNGAWGILLNDYADFPPPQTPYDCRGGIANYNAPPPFDQLYGATIPCYFRSFGNRVTYNAFHHNGFFGNPTNGDLANAVLPYSTDNCFAQNVDGWGGTPSSSPTDLQDPKVAGTCGRAWQPDIAQVFLLTDELGCASLGPISGACTGLPPPLYPLRTQVQLFPIPNETGMADPCSGVPQNSWCAQP